MINKNSFKKGFLTKKAGFINHDSRLLGVLAQMKQGTGRTRNWKQKRRKRVCDSRFSCWPLECCFVHVIRCTRQACKLYNSRQTFSIPHLSRKKTMGNPCLGHKDSPQTDLKGNGWEGVNRSYLATNCKPSPERCSLQVHFVSVARQGNKLWNAQGRDHGIHIPLSAQDKMISYQCSLHTSCPSERRT